MRLGSGYEVSMAEELLCVHVCVHVSVCVCVNKCRGCGVH